MSDRGEESLTAYVADFIKRARAAAGALAHALQIATRLAAARVH
jgi:hypothetical protein